MKHEVSKYLGRFAAEAQEHLGQLSDLLIRLEKTPEAEVGAIYEALLRHAHSLKGGAGMLGLTASAQMAHRFEDWLGGLRCLRDETAATSPSANLIDALLLAVDYLGQLAQAEGNGHPLPTRPALLDHIERQLGTAAFQVKARPEQPSDRTDIRQRQIAREQVTSAPRFKLRLTIAPSSQMPALRAFLAHRKLAALGPILEASPPAEELRAGNLPDGRLTLDLSAEFTAIARAVQALSEIERAEISALDAEGAIACPAPRDLMAPCPPQPPRALASDRAQPDGRALPREAMPLDHGSDSSDARQASLPGPSSAAPRTLRVKAELLDTLLDSVGDFILSIARLREQAGDGTKALLADGRPALLLEGLDDLHLRARSIHNQVLAARMMPLSSITGQLARAARDLARQQGRELEFTVSGDEVVLDHAVLDVLGDPLLHLIRNAVDHGLEPAEERAAKGKSKTGHISLSARREHAHVLIEIADDGRGLSSQKLKAAARDRGLITPSQCEALSEREAWQLCFLPGLTTAEQLSDISGRGVGMDVVKSAIEGVGGSIDLASRPGQGTIWSLALPYTVAIAHVLFVRLGKETFGIPISRIAHVALAAADAFSVSQGQPFFSWRGALLPVFSLGARLRIEADFWPGDRPRPLILAEGGDRLLALQVDALLGQQRSILRPLKPPLDRIRCLAGVTLRTSGLPAFILDVPRLFARSVGPL